MRVTVESCSNERQEPRHSREGRKKGLDAGIGVMQWPPRSDFRKCTYGPTPTAVYILTAHRSSLFQSKRLIALNGRSEA
jgi:hypothetical protein